MNSENHSSDLPELPQGRFNSMSREPQQCDDIAPLIPAHSIEATDPAEVVHINALLAECPRTAAELATYRQFATRLLYGAPVAAAPPVIAERLQARIAAGNSATPNVAATPPHSPFARRQAAAPPPNPTPRRAPSLAPLPATMANYALQPVALDKPRTHPAKERRWLFGERRVWGRALAIAIALLLLTTNGALWLQNQQLQQEQAILAADLAQQNRALILLAAEEPQEIELFDPDGITTARADILWNESLGLAVIYVRDFPECKSGMKYQLWLTSKDGVRTSGGLFSVDTSGMGLLVLSLEQALDTYELIGITPEPAGGSLGPTAPPIVRGSI